MLCGWCVLVVCLVCVVWLLFGCCVVVVVVVDDDVVVVVVVGVGVVGGVGRLVSVLPFLSTAVVVVIRPCSIMSAFRAFIW